MGTQFNKNAQNPKVPETPDMRPGPRAQKYLDEFDTKYVRPALAEAAARVKSEHAEAADKMKLYDKAHHGNIDAMLSESESRVMMTLNTELRRAYDESVREFLAQGRDHLDEKALRVEIEKFGKEALKRMRDDERAYLGALGELVDGITEDREVSVDELLRLSFFTKNLTAAIRQKIEKAHMTLLEKIIGRKKLAAGDYRELVGIIKSGKNVQAADMEKSLDAQAGASVAGLFLSQLDRKQMFELIDVWSADRDPAVAEYIEAMVVTGRLQADESTLKLFEKTAQAGTITREKFNEYSRKITGGELQKKREAFLARMEKIKHTLLDKKSYRRPGEILNIPTLLAARVGELGGLTALVNIIFNIKDPNAIVSNPYVWGGIATFIAATEKVTGNPYGKDMLDGFGRGEVTEFVTGPSENEKKQREAVIHASRLADITSEFHIKKLMLGSPDARKALAALMRKKKHGEPITVAELRGRLANPQDQNLLDEFAKTASEPDKRLAEMGIRMQAIGLTSPAKMARFIKTADRYGAEKAVAHMKLTLQNVQTT